MPTITESDEYARILALVEQGRLPASIPAKYQGVEGLWSYDVNIDQSRIVTDEDVLGAAIVAIRAAYRSARRAGAKPLV
jgi:hypothetical protein